ncbi:MAG: hypothetical protein H6565_14465 [Lewinellaceae bacterium]|nr:hypothetical protein [Lewinellaceae bacterium]
MMDFRRIAFWAFLVLPAAGCIRHQPAGNSDKPIGEKVSDRSTPGFKEYWYRGMAELSTYEVEQERYGEMRRAEQVNIFVTEDFSKSKQVKLDAPQDAGADRVPILKLNAVRRFHTGIYEYTLMESVFTPVDASPSLKATYSVMDWCGQVFSQFNLKGNGYRARLFSYFENEGDTDQQLKPAMLEDELMTRIRIDPFSIPAGKTDLIPSPFYLRFRHKPYEIHKADIEIEKGERESKLTVRYAELDRTLTIRFETNFPHRILGWEEMDGEHLLSRGRLKTTMMSDYWRRHDNGSEFLRDSLKLVF